MPFDPTSTSDGACGVASMSSSTSQPINAVEGRLLLRLLEKLKSRELKTCSLDEQILITRLLLAEPKDSTSRHWYCNLATDLTREAATYCQVWLVAKDKTTEALVNWTKCHQKILDSCANCVKGMEDALLGSQLTYVPFVSAFTACLNRFQLSF
jgi:hypothetical protein